MQQTLRRCGAPAANVWQEDDLCSRPDVLSFESDALDAPLHFAGRIEVGLTVASDAPDTAFTAKLVEVLPDGTLALRRGVPLAAAPGANRALSQDGYGACVVLPGSRLAELTPADLQANDRFGASIGQTNKRALIGAPRANDFGDQSGDTHSRVVESRRLARPPPALTI